VPSYRVFTRCADGIGPVRVARLLAARRSEVGTPRDSRKAELHRLGELRAGTVPGRPDMAWPGRDFGDRIGTWLRRLR
jgi:hypothetical protein